MLERIRTHTDRRCRSSYVRLVIDTGRHQIGPFRPAASDLQGRGPEKERIRMAITNGWRVGFCLGCSSRKYGQLPQLLHVQHKGFSRNERRHRSSVLQLGQLQFRNRSATGQRFWFSLLKQCAVPINRTTLRRDQFVISRIHCILFLTPRFLSKYFRMGYLENGDDEESKVRQMASEAKLTLHSLLLYRPLALRFPVRIVQSNQRNARRKTNLSLSLSLSEGTKATTRRVGQKR